MKIETLKLLVALLDGEPSAAQSTSENKSLGQNIVVLDRGFVYVGQVTEEGEYLRVKKCRNIRYWGTKNGLGELTKGPLEETKLDDVGEILAPKRALIHLVPCTGF